MKPSIDSFIDIVGEQGLLSADDIAGRSGWHGYSCTAQVLVRPSDTEQLCQVVQRCNDLDQSMVVHGGRTGLTGGANATEADIIISLERFNQTALVNADNRTLTVAAGVTLSAAQQVADEHDLALTLDLGARGSATIGGLLSTNAGGNQVIRQGMARDQVLGLEAVLADGRILSSMNQMIKNNAGYDLKQLLIGSEGTLGIIAHAVLRLRPKLPFCQSALMAVDDFNQLPKLLNFCDAKLGGQLSAFEVMWQSFIRIAAFDERLPKFPLDANHPYYVLIEMCGNNDEVDRQTFIDSLEAAIESGYISDAMIAQSGRERDYFWQIRDNIDYLMSDLAPLSNFDISLPIDRMSDYLDEIDVKLTALLGDKCWVIFGHLGDSNLHIMVHIDTDIEQCETKIEQIIYQSLSSRSGSITAEHGVGREKKPYLPLCRNAVEIDTMRQLKQLFDPNNLLNNQLIF